jgi:hypothetical protein
MLFLIQYDRRAGRIISLKSFADDQRVIARKARLDLEIELQHRGQNHEVVWLEAASEEALRKTHGRYFEDVEHLLTVAMGVWARQTRRGQPQISPTACLPKLAVARKLS